MRKPEFDIATLTPTEMIKRDIVRLKNEATDHRAKAHSSDDEKWAFYVKTEALSIQLEPYTSSKVKELVFAHYEKLEKKIKEIENNSNLNPENKKKEKMNTLFILSLPVYKQNVRILQNSPIVEIEAEGTIDLSREDIEGRVKTGGGRFSSGVKVEAIWKKEGDNNPRQYTKKPDKQ